MGHRSIEFVKTHFALPLVIDQYCDLYNQVLGARSLGDADLRSQAGKDAALGRLGEVRQ